MSRFPAISLATTRTGGPTAPDVGIADALAEGPLSADHLASAVDADADALCRLLTRVSAPPPNTVNFSNRAGFRLTRVVETASPFSVVEATAI